MTATCSAMAWYVRDRRTRLLAACLAGLIVLAGSTARGQDPPAFPGSGASPIPPSFTTQVHDDELGVMVFPRPQSGVDPRWSLLGLGTLVFPRSATDLYPEPRPGFDTRFATEPALYFDPHGVAVGRFVNPNRDTILVLTRIDTSQTGQITWRLAEISMGTYSDTQPPFTPASPGQLGSTGVPALTFTRPVPSEQPFSTLSAGAIAAGDLDLKIDATGAFSDEIAAVVGSAPPGGGPFAFQRLLVVSYGEGPNPVIQAEVLLPSPYSYLPGAVLDGVSPVLFPAPATVAIADVDGDGQREIAVVTVTFDPARNFHNLQAILYRYDAGDATATPPRAPALTLLSVVSLDGAPNGQYTLNPVSLATGDLDGDRREELLVLDVTNVRLDTAPTRADLHLVVAGWNDTTKQLQTVLDQKLSGNIEAWEDDGQGGVFFTDAKVVTGQFAYDATGKIPLAQRSAAVLFKEHGSSDYHIETWNVARAADTGAWSATKADRVSVTTCGGSHNWADLAAGSWVGVYAGFDNPSPWGLAVTYETRDRTGTPKQTLVLAAVDITTQKITLGTPTLFDGPAIEPDRDCGKAPYGALVFPLDADGDSLRVGPPIHMTVANLNYFDFLIQEPPKHVDWLPGVSGADPDTGVLNVSRLTAFNVTYTDTSGTSFSTTTSKTSGQTWGGGVTGDIRFNFGEDFFGLEKNDVTLDFGFHASRYNESQKTAFTGKDSTWSQTLEATTLQDDVLRFYPRTIDIWRYPLYGHRATVPDDPAATFSYYEISLPRALCLTQGDSDPSTCPKLDGTNGLHVDGYEPWHENGNLLSYPAVPDECGTQCQPLPPDLGAWKRPHQQDKLFDDTNGPCRWDKSDLPNTDLCTLPLTAPAIGTFPGAQNTTVTMSHDGVTGNSRTWGHTIDGGFDLGVGFQVGWGPLPKIGGLGISGCIDGYYDKQTTTSNATGSQTTTSESQNISVNSKLVGNADQAYNFYPIMYVATGGALKVAHAAGTFADVTSAGFWATTYARPDPALNLPRRFVSSAATPDVWLLNAAPEAQAMRGFLVLNGNPKAKDSYQKPVARPPAIGDPTFDNKILLQARVYNYAAPAREPMQNAGRAAASVKVRFDIVELDAFGNECTDPTSCRTRQVLQPSSGTNPVVATCLNPYNPDGKLQHPQDCVFGATTLPPRGMGTATIPIDLTTLAPRHGNNSTTYHVYVVVDPDNAFPTQTHGWRQVAVVVTPGGSVSTGDAFSLDVFQGNTKAETVTYRIDSPTEPTVANVLKGLAAAFNKSHTAKTFGLAALVIDEGPNRIENRSHLQITPADVAGAKLKPSTEYRAGFVDSAGRSFYFVPTATGTTGNFAPTLTATNNVPGQNNEGYGVLTVWSAATLLGGDDPVDRCKPQHLDLALDGESFAAKGRDGVFQTGAVRAHPDEHLPIRVTALANQPSQTHEYVEIYLGHPAAGKRLARKLVRGVDGEQGGAAAWTWRTPGTPGVYTLYARVEESHGDVQPANNVTPLTVIVAPDDDTAFVGVAASAKGRPGRGWVKLAGTRSLAGPVDLANASVIVWQLLDEQGSGSELVHGKDGAAHLPVTLVLRQQQNSPGKRPGKPDRAVFESPPGTTPRVTLTLSKKHSQAERLDFSLEVDEATIAAAQGCGGTPSATDLTTTFTIEGAGEPLVVSATEPWRCLPNGFRTLHSQHGKP